MIKIAHSRILEVRSGWSLFPITHAEAKNLETSGEYLSELLERLNGELPPNSTVIDLGSVFGISTLSFARRLAPNGRVFSLADDRKSFQNLCANLALNAVDNVKPMEMLTSDDPAQRFFDGGKELSLICGKLPKVPDLNTLKTSHCSLIFSGLSPIRTFEILENSLEFIRANTPAIVCCLPHEASSEPLRALLNSLDYEINEEAIPIVGQHPYFGERIPGNSPIRVISGKPAICQS